MATTALNANWTAKTAKEMTESLSEMKKGKHGIPCPQNATMAERTGIGEWKAFRVGGGGQADRPRLDAVGSLSSEETPMTTGGFFPALLEALKAQTDAITSLVETLNPEAPDFVGTDYIARRMGCSPQWVGKMADKGDIPKECIVPKVSGGRIWKFHRRQTDAWLQRKGDA